MSASRHDARPAPTNCYIADEAGIYSMFALITSICWRAGRVATLESYPNRALYVDAFSIHVVSFAHRRRGYGSAGGDTNRQNPSMFSHLPNGIIRPAREMPGQQNVHKIQRKIKYLHG